MDLKEISEFSLVQMNFIADNPDSKQAQLANQILSIAVRMRKVRNDRLEPSAFYLGTVVTLIRNLCCAVEPHEIEAVLTAAGLDLKTKSSGAN